MGDLGKGQLKDKHGPARGLELWAAERWPTEPGGRRGEAEGAPCFQMQAAQAGTPAYSEDGQASEKKNNQRVKGLENREFPVAISLPCV